MITIKKVLGGHFATRAEAVLALQQLQFVFAMGGYKIVSTYISEYSLELQVHFDKNMPQMPTGYKASYSEVTSHPSKDGTRIRVKTFFFF